MREKLIKVTILLFLLIVFFTVISRGIRNYSYPRVKTDTAEAGVITNIVEAEGVVKGNETGVVSAVNGITVASVYVTEGEAVQEGSLLFQYSMDSVTKQLEMLQGEKQILELQMQEANDAVSAVREQEAKNYDYAVDELERITSQQNQLVEEAEAEWKSRMESDGDDAGTEEAKLKYESALQARDEAIRQARQQVELASVPSAESTSAQQIEVSLQQKEKEIGRLEQIVETEGSVYAAAEGTVQTIYLQAGTAAGDSAMTIMLNQGSKSAVVSVDEETAELIVQGDLVEVTARSTELEEPAEATVIAKNQNQESGEWQITADVSSSGLAVGEKVTVSLVRSSADYMNILPREAVRRESGNVSFVYVVTEEDSILGSVFFLEKREVEVLDADPVHAAVDGVSSLERIVVDSDRQLSGDCHVMLSEEGGNDS